MAAYSRLELTKNLNDVVLNSEKSRELLIAWCWQYLWLMTESLLTKVTLPGYWSLPSTFHNSCHLYYFFQIFLSLAFYCLGGYMFGRLSFFSHFLHVSPPSYIVVSGVLSLDCNHLKGQLLFELNSYSFWVVYQFSVSTVS